MASRDDIILEAVTTARSGTEPDADTPAWSKARYFTAPYARHSDVSSLRPPVQVRGNIELPELVRAMCQPGQLHRPPQFGLWTEVRKAYCVADNRLVIWDYRENRQVLRLSQHVRISQAIVAVGLVVPRFGVFPSTVRYLLVVATAFSVQLVPITLAGNTVRGAMQVHRCDLTQLSCPVADGTGTKVVGTRDGRIFLATYNGSLVEILYTTEQVRDAPLAMAVGLLPNPRVWTRNRTATETTGHQVRALVGDMFWPALPTVDIVSDPYRGVLYTLGLTGEVKAYSVPALNPPDWRPTSTLFGYPEGDMAPVLCGSLSAHRLKRAFDQVEGYSMATTGGGGGGRQQRSLLWPLRSMHVVNPSEMTGVDLVLVAESGARVGLALQRGGADAASGTLRPVFLRPPPLRAAATGLLHEEPQSRLRSMDEAFAQCGEPLRAVRDTLDTVRTAYYGGGVFLGCFRDTSAGGEYHTVAIAQDAPTRVREGPRKVVSGRVDCDAESVNPLADVEDKVWSIGEELQAPALGPGLVFAASGALLLPSGETVPLPPAGTAEVVERRAALEANQRLHRRDASAGGSGAGSGSASGVGLRRSRGEFGGPASAATATDYEQHVCDHFPTVAVAQTRGRRGEAPDVRSTDLWDPAQAHFVHVCRRLDADGAKDRAATLKQPLYQMPELAAQAEPTPPRSFVILSSSGVWFADRVRAADQMAAALVTGAGEGSRAALPEADELVALLGWSEAAAVCTALYCGEPVGALDGAVPEAGPGHVTRPPMALQRAAAATLERIGELMREQARILDLEAGERGRGGAQAAAYGRDLGDPPGLFVQQSFGVRVRGILLHADRIVRPLWNAGPLLLLPGGGKGLSGELLRCLAHGRVPTLAPLGDWTAAKRSRQQEGTGEADVVSGWAAGMSALLFGGGGGGGGGEARSAAAGASGARGGHRSSRGGSSSTSSTSASSSAARGGAGAMRDAFPVRLRFTPAELMSVGDRLRRLLKLFQEVVRPTGDLTDALRVVAQRRRLAQDDLARGGAGSSDAEQQQLHLYRQEAEAEEWCALTFVDRCCQAVSVLAVLAQRGASLGMLLADVDEGLRDQLVTLTFRDLVMESGSKLRAVRALVDALARSTLASREEDRVETQERRIASQLVARQAVREAEGEGSVTALSEGWLMAQLEAAAEEARTAGSTLDHTPTDQLAGAAGVVAEELRRLAPDYVAPDEVSRVKALALLRKSRLATNRSARRRTREAAAECFLAACRHWRYGATMQQQLKQFCREAELAGHHDLVLSACIGAARAMAVHEARLDSLSADDLDRLQQVLVRDAEGRQAQQPALVDQEARSMHARVTCYRVAAAHLRKVADAVLSGARGRTVESLTRWAEEVQADRSESAAASRAGVLRPRGVLRNGGARDAGSSASSPEVAALALLLEEAMSHADAVWLEVLFRWAVPAEGEEVAAGPAAAGAGGEQGRAAQVQLTELVVRCQAADKLLEAYLRDRASHNRRARVEYLVARDRLADAAREEQRAALRAHTDLDRVEITERRSRLSAALALASRQGVRVAGSVGAGVVARWRLLEAFCRVQQRLLHKLLAACDVGDYDKGDQRVTDMKQSLRFDPPEGTRLLRIARAMHAHPECIELLCSAPMQQVVHPLVRQHWEAIRTAALEDIRPGAEPAVALRQVRQQLAPVGGLVFRPGCQYELPLDTELVVPLEQWAFASFRGAGAGAAYDAGWVAVGLLSELRSGADANRDVPVPWARRWQAYAAYARAADGSLGGDTAAGRAHCCLAIAALVQGWVEAARQTGSERASREDTDALRHEAVPNELGQLHSGLEAVADQSPLVADALKALRQARAAVEALPRAGGRRSNGVWGR